MYMCWERWYVCEYRCLGKLKVLGALKLEKEL